MAALPATSPVVPRTLATGDAGHAEAYRGRVASAS
jgi:hypothetical protein